MAVNLLLLLYNNKYARGDYVSMPSNWNTKEVINGIHSPIFRKIVKISSKLLIQLYSKFGQEYVSIEQRLNPLNKSSQIFHREISIVNKVNEPSSYRDNRIETSWQRQAIKKDKRCDQS